ncbi:MAG: glycosyltransferase family 2 protein [Promethearchaeota archaeon]
MKGKDLYTLFIIFFVVSLGTYFISSSFSLSNAQVSAATRFYNVILLFLELVIVVILFCVNLGTRASFSEKPLLTETSILKEYPMVTVIIPIFNEPIRLVKNTIVALSRLRYPTQKLEIYFADDSTRKYFIRWCQKECERVGIHYVHRKGRINRRVGALNNIIFNYSKGEYIILFDADNLPKEDAIQKLLYEFYNTDNDKLAFVQGIFDITNNATIAARLSYLFEYVYFTTVISRLNEKGLCVLSGHTCCIKKSALLEIGGIQGKTFQDDYETSIVFFVNGFEGKRANFHCSSVVAPTTIRAFLNMYSKWLLGGLSVFRTYFWSILTSKKMPSRQKINLYISFSAMFMNLFVVLWSMGLLLLVLLNIPFIRGIVALWVFAFSSFAIFMTIFVLNGLLNAFGVYVMYLRRGIMLPRLFKRVFPTHPTTMIAGNTNTLDCILIDALAPFLLILIPFLVFFQYLLVLFGRKPRFFLTEKRENVKLVRNFRSEITRVIIVLLGFIFLYATYTVYFTNRILAFNLFGFSLALLLMLPLAIFEFIENKNKITGEEYDQLEEQKFDLEE